MITTPQPTITQARDLATHYTLTNQLALAEASYRDIIDTVQQHQGQHATHADRYNLCNILVQQHKYTEAEPIAKDLVVWLAKRPVDDENAHFLEQQAGAVRLLVQSLKGLGRDEEVDELLVGARFDGREERLRARKQFCGLADE
ncbi:unnamed protein product [Aureobasidium vineae]|uniref:Uncharacterized protein n=1 Tax=Aureobasidium vineae TaxID=2773715 RepID=A0A9N8J9L7_9PEZI|nr:unnamed protein product [Aureobasidium vineae]